VRQQGQGQFHIGHGMPRAAFVGYGLGVIGGSLLFYEPDFHGMPTGPGVKQSNFECGFDGM